jgi:hypothetical protein
MHELHEACTLLRSGTLSEGSLKRICSALQRRAGRDPALSNEEKNHLRQQITSVPRAETPQHHAIAQMAAWIDVDYLRRWARVVATPNFTVELFARSVAAHLLDHGFSPEHLHRLIKGHMQAPGQVTLAEVCEDLHAELTRSPPREFQVLLAFARSPEIEHGVPADWLRGGAVTAWLEEHGFETANVRSQLAVVLTVEARDGAGAGQAAREISDRYAARARIATGKPLERLPWLWVAGDGRPALHAAQSRGVRVKELDREGRIFTPTDSLDNVDAAIELLAHLDESSPPAAIAGGWGAIEGLLADPNDRANAAENLATLVACSLPRAELTYLAFKTLRDHPALAPHFAAAQTNRDRCLVAAQLISSGQLTPPRSYADRAAVDRIRRLLQDPSQQLVNIKETIAEAFHRLYRQRNIILHAGRLDSVSLKASLRTVAKLAGAGMDRITHGHYVQQLRPMELVARADLSIALINRQTALNCVDLLERVQGTDRALA